MISFFQCGRHLRVISAPNSPCKVIVRGDACKCPKPIPYRVEIPHPPICKPCERKAYGYTVQTLKYDEPEDPIYYQYGFQIQVPKVEERPARHYVGLSTKCDRVVIPATDGKFEKKRTYLNDNRVKIVSNETTIYRCFF